MDIEDIRAVVREELAGKRKPPRNRDNRPVVTIRMFPEELAAMDAACLARGINRSELLRLALAPIIPGAIQPRQETPEAFRKAHNRRKPTHFAPPDTDTRAREEASRRAVTATIAARAAQAEARAYRDTPAIAHGMLSDAQGRGASRKLSR